jgi:hypothetical protein
MTACLVNCSNQGVCKLNAQTLKYFCECNQYFTGKSCQTDERPCSQSNKCLNNGKCVNSQNLISFTCQCPQNGPFYGQYCEHIINLCENVTCSSHGYCKQSQNEIKCKCFKGYNGDKCEIESNSSKATKYVQWLATAICILFILTVCTLTISSDVLNYFKICAQRIDLNEWKREKLYGEKRKKRVKRNKVNRKHKWRMVQKISKFSNPKKTHLNELKRA